MPTHHSIDIYKASAGSGKTFLLTMQYITLALQHPGYFRSILAVTFTNKATAEMKQRISKVLCGLAIADKRNEIESYRRLLLQQHPDWTETQLQQKAKAAYSAILHDYSRFSVLTIDSFVQRIVRSFSWELGIDSGFKIQLDINPVKEDLTQRMYKRLDSDKALQRWTINMATERLDNGKRWDFKEDILNLAGELFKEKFADFEEALAGFDEKELHAAFSSMKKKARQAFQQIETHWKATGNNILQLLQEHDLSADDFAYKKNGFIGIFIKIVNNGQPIPLGDRASGVLQDPDKMLPKNANTTLKQKVGAIAGELINALQQISDDYDKDISLYQTAIAISRNVSELRMMSVLTEQLAAYRADNNALLMSDTGKLLRELTKDTPAAFIYEKTGNRFQHFLIDEFQDTSRFQWSNFLPLLTEALSQGNYNLLVGDVKQAIYRFRNGDWRLLLQEAQQNLAAFHPQQQTLQDNYRSTVAVIQFNNLLFYLAPLILQNVTSQLLANQPAAIQHQLDQQGYQNIFNEAYADSFQQIPATAGNNGSVNIQFIAGKDENNEKVEYKEAVLPLMFSQIQSLLAEGYAAKDLAVLTRNNKEARLVVSYLMEAQQDGGIPFRIISAEALLLASDQVVQMIISALRYVNNSKHTIALAQLKQLVLLQQGQYPNSLNVYASNANSPMLPQAFMNQIEWLRSLSLMELLHQLVLIFGWHQHEKSQPFLLAFYDKVKEWTRNGEKSLDDFLQYWDEEGIKAALPASDGIDALEVLTIHKSKGLAFTILLMPFINWSLLPEPTKSPILWVNNSTTAFNDIEVVPVKYQQALQNSAFASNYFEEMMLSTMDNLNLLYVAFTRAKQRVYGWAPQKANEKKEDAEDASIKDVGQLLYAVATSNHALPPANYTDTRLQFDKETLIWQFGEPHRYNEPAKEEVVPDAPPFIFSNWRQKIKMKFQPFTGNEKDENLLPRDQGILLHEMLSKLQQPNQLSTLLTKVQQEGWMDNRQLDKAKQLLQAVLAMDALKPWHSGLFQRLPERNLLNKERQLRRPDMVLYNAEETIVYDFKFTAGDNKVEQHQLQVKEYMTLLEQMGFAHVKGIVIYGLNQQAIVV